jgi:ring-1,2-phenylacetyl-CoA epoxidase subunit PaaC
LAAAGIGVDPAGVRAEFDAVLAQVLDAATLRSASSSDGHGSRTASPVTATAAEDVPAGRGGAHTEAMTEILGEMQGLARSLPGGVW